jgi:hypothetical protein
VLLPLICKFHFRCTHSIIVETFVDNIFVTFAICFLSQDDISSSPQQLQSDSAVNSLALQQLHDNIQVAPAPQPDDALIVPAPQFGAPQVGVEESLSVSGSMHFTYAHAIFSIPPLTPLHSYLLLIHISLSPTLFSPSPTLFSPSPTLFSPSPTLFSYTGLD